MEHNTEHSFHSHSDPDTPDRERTVSHSVERRSFHYHSFHYRSLRCSCHKDRYKEERSPDSPDSLDIRLPEVAAAVHTETSAPLVAEQTLERDSSDALVRETTGPDWEKIVAAYWVDEIDKTQDGHAPSETVKRQADPKRAPDSWAPQTGAHREIEQRTGEEERDVAFARYCQHYTGPEARYWESSMEETPLSQEPLAVDASGDRGAAPYIQNPRIQTFSTNIDYCTGITSKIINKYTRN